MSWLSDKAIERVVKLAKRSKGQVFEEDVNAIKLINETIFESEKRLVTDNLLFAKLVLYILNLNLHNSGSMKDAVASLRTVLSNPLNDGLETLTLNMNTQELNNYLKTIGVDFDSLKNETETIKKTEKQLIEKIQSNWTIQKVNKSFCNTVNEFLKDTDNYF